jgi:cytochrome c oxidase accessory protein FixG
MPDIIASSSDSSVRYVDRYQAADKIYTRRVKGFYQRLRRYTGIPLLAAFLFIPWIQIDNRPAMLFDLSAQKFHIFWMTFWPQDGILLAWLLMIAAFLLFTVTVLVGRVWCGFTCPQTVWTLMYIWAEDKCEGDRNQRIKLDQQPWSLDKKGFNKLWRKSAKQSIWLLIALITGLTFVGYFYGIRDLVVDFATLKASGETYFWVAFFLLFTYLNAGWLREQVCKYMCPYARFQSVMYDDHTMLVTYDHLRGENRGARKTNSDYQSQGLGDCIDCNWCVQVCPVDIDIRDGLQAECIDCGLCVDACNNVMDKMGYARGLIRFTTQDIINGGKKHIWRPRFIGYLISSIVITGLFIGMTANRTPLSVDVVRDRGSHLFHLANQRVENVYTVKINNMDRGQQRYQISLKGNPAYQFKGMRTVTLEESEVLAVPIRVSIPRDKVERSNDSFFIVVTSLQQPEISAQQLTRFLAPLPATTAETH